MIDFTLLKRAMVAAKEQDDIGRPTLKVLIYHLRQHGAITDRQADELNEAFSQDTLFGSLGESEEVNR